MAAKDFADNVDDCSQPCSLDARKGAYKNVISAESEEEEKVLKNPSEEKR